MTEHPILFSAPMVRAILDGKKTQTRRVVKPQPSYGLGYMLIDGKARPVGADYPDHPSEAIRCPYGQPGDRLWVREAFFDHGPVPGDPDTPIDERIEYRAEEWDRVDPTDAGPWSPSIHMSRWASRITLELTDVRVQRVQEITEDDARAEGFAPGEPMTEMDIELMRGTEVHELAKAIGLGSRMSAKFAFLCTWDDLNEKRGYSWHVNPWVWALTFKRAESAT